MRTAVIGIGSNSVRMLLGDIDGGQGIRLQRDRAGTRLFAGLDERGCLSPEAMDLTSAAVQKMAESARDLGAQEVILFATSATRDAANADVFREMLRARADVELRVLTGEEEAKLSFLGATGPGRCGVIDIGGGSTELVWGEGHSLDLAFSCQMGAVRLSRLFPMESVQDLAPVIQKAKDILLEKYVPHRDILPAASWYGTGGTFTTLAAMINGVPWTDRTLMHGTKIPYERVVQEAKLLAPMTVDERKTLPGLQPNRADIIVHGICILIACMETLSIDTITVSEYGNLDGFMIYHYGLTSLSNPM